MEHGLPKSAGIIGYGVLGRAFAERLRRAEIACVVYDVSDAALQDAAASGFRVAESAAAVAAESEFVSLTVRTDEETLAASCGGDGVLASARAGTLLVHSTVAPATVRDVAERAAKVGVEVVEAPVVGRPPIIAAGNATFLVGGSAESIERTTPYLLALGQSVLSVGPVGAASVAKLITNLVKGAERLVVAEALQLGEAYGIDSVTALELLRTLSADNEPLVERWQQAFDVSSSGARLRTAGLHLFDKDIPLAVRLARDADLELPVTEEVAAAGLRLAEPRSF